MNYISDLGTGSGAAHPVKELHSRADQPRLLSLAPLFRECMETCPRNVVSVNWHSDLPMRPPCFIFLKSSSWTRKMKLFLQDGANTGLSGWLLQLFFFMFVVCFFLPRNITPFSLWPKTGYYTGPLNIWITPLFDLTRLRFPPVLFRSNTTKRIKTRASENNPSCPLRGVM